MAGKCHMVGMPPHETCGGGIKQTLRPEDLTLTSFALERASVSLLTSGLGLCDLPLLLRLARRPPTPVPH